MVGYFRLVRFFFLLLFLLTVVIWLQNVLFCCCVKQSSYLFVKWRTIANARAVSVYISLFIHLNVYSAETSCIAVLNLDIHSYTSLLHRASPHLSVSVCVCGFFVLFLIKQTALIRTHRERETILHSIAYAYSCVIVQHTRMHAHTNLSPSSRNALPFKNWIYSIIAIIYV